MKNAFLFLFMLAAVSCFAQNDSLTVVHTKWQTTKLAPGIRLKEHAFSKSLFGANQYVSIIEVKQNRKNHLDLAADPKVLKITSEFGSASNAIGAINGTFFDIANGGSVDYIRSNGIQVNVTRLNAKGRRASHQKSAVVLDKGKLSIVAWDGTADWEQKLKGEDVMVTGPLLVTNNNLAPLDSGSLEKMRHPRSAVAMVGKKVLYITIDGRNIRADGMTLHELALLMRYLGASEGLNLDGGGSTTLWVRDTGVVNHPSDNKKLEQSPLYKPGMDLDSLPANIQKWDHEGQRKVANVLIVTRP